MVRTHVTYLLVETHPLCIVDFSVVHTEECGDEAERKLHDLVS